MTLLCVICCGACRGELADKAGWAALQGAEFRDRSSTSSGTEIQRLPSGFAVLAVQGRGQMQGGPVSGAQSSRRSWILLNEHAYDERIKQMPTFEAYDLPCSDVDGLEQRVPDIDAYVTRFLQAICGR